MERLTLVTGGARSGKSTFALERANACDGKKIFIATAVPFDDEMRDRIRKHREERACEGFETVEAPLALAAALRDLPHDAAITVVDCITVWLGNLFHEYQSEDAALDRAIEDFLAAVRECPQRVLFVTNEVGCGIVPENALARRFRDAQGLLNRRLAALCDGAVMVVCGIPMHLTPLPPLLKERGPGCKKEALPKQEKV